MWRALPVQGTLAHVLCIQDPDFARCPLFNGDMETLEHLFIFCPFAQSAWRQAPWPIAVDALHNISMVSCLCMLIDPVSHFSLHPIDEHAFVVFAAVALDLIWFARNKRVHEGTHPDSNLLIRSIQRCHRDHLLARADKAS